MGGAFKHNLGPRGREFERAIDKKFFDGDINFLKQVASEVSIPVLRKDFILSKAQIIESGINSADSLLLISEILESSQLNYLYNFARKLNLIPLVELHSRKAWRKFLI